MTVGYICPGWYNPAFGAPDPWANYYGRVDPRGRGWPIAITRHSPSKLDVSLSEYTGVHLTDQALQVLADDAVTVVCPA